VVARKDWISLGLDLNSDWVYEHRTFTPENCEKCILRKPSKPITVRFQINTETGEIEWVNSGKTVMHGEKLINCIKETMLGNVLVSGSSSENVREDQVLGRKRSLGKTSSDEDHSDQDFLGMKKRLKRSKVGARKSMDSCVSDDFRLTQSFGNPGYVASGTENNGILTSFQPNSDFVKSSLQNYQTQINFQNSNLPVTTLQNTNFQNSDSNTLMFDQNISDSRNIESPNSYIQVDSPNFLQMQNNALQNAALQNAALQNAALQNATLQNTDLQNIALQNSALQNTIIQNSILLNLSRQNSPLQISPLQNSALQNSPLQNSLLQKSPLQNSNLQTSPLPTKHTSNSISSSIAPCSTASNSASSPILAPSSILATSSIPTSSLQSNYQHFLIPHVEQPNQILQLIPMIVQTSGMDATKTKWTTVDELAKK